MYSLYIDNILCDNLLTQKIEFENRAGVTNDVELLCTAQSVKIALGGSAANDAIFKGNGLTHAAQKFNAQQHTGRIECKGYDIFEGAIYLQRVEWQGHEIIYHVEIKGGVAMWAYLAARQMFNKFLPDYESTLNTPYFEQAWESDDAVKFFPVQRDSYKVQGAGHSAQGVQIIKSVDSYHPFVNIRELMLEIFENGGYSVESEFMDSELFRSLYMSGNYSSLDSAVARANLDFKVARAEDGEAIADPTGRVYMMGNQNAYSVGSIVDLQTLESRKECFSNGNCLGGDETGVAFTPLTSISVGFEYNIRYEAEYSIKSRAELKCFNRIYLDDANLIEFKVPNPLQDMRGKLNAMHEYLFVCFDFEQGAEYTLRGTKIGGAPEVIATITSRTQKVAIREEYQFVNLYSSSGVLLIPYGGDWALYDGYIEERGRMDFNLIVRTPPQSVTPTSPKRFDTAYMDGAQAGAEFKILSDSYIRPYFAAHPGINSTISFSDIGHHQVRQIKLLESVQQMFNLRFYSDELLKRVYIEPFDDIYRKGKRIDWSDRVICSEPIEFNDLSQDIHRTRKWGYQLTDGVIKRAEADSELATPFGEWSATLESYDTKSGSLSIMNPLFCPSLTNEDGILQVGDRDDLELVDSLNFSPRVVRLLGIEDVEGQQVPKVRFFSAEDEVSLCFENRDGVEGLNRYYQRQVALENNSQEVVLSIKLEVKELMSLFTPCDVPSQASLLDLIHLKIGGDSHEAILSGIESYDFEHEVARCSFWLV